MIKKIVAAFVLLFLSGSAFAVNVEELNTGFFTRFNDDCLNYYIETALKNNYDLKKAGNVVEQYRQQAKYSLGKELPSLSVSANYLGVHVPRLDNFQLEQNAFILPFIANYEPDFLLKNRDKTRSAKKAYEAAIYEEKSVYISLLGDVAAVYTNILQYDYLIELQNESVKALQGVYLADSRKYARGVIDSTELHLSKQNLENADSQLKKLEKERDTLLMQLAVLCGLSPEGINNLQRGTLAAFEYSGEIPSGVVSDVIYSRPDVMKAEKNLEKAKIDVRIARKEFLPSFNITGVWIFNTIAPGSFFSWESSLASILAGATQDIFKGGMKVANLRMQKAKYEELFNEYRQVDLNAVKEINTALCIVKQDTAVDKNTLSIVQSQKKIFENAERKYNRGVISTPDYLNEYNKLLSSKQESAQAKTQRIVDYFTLYKAVGGKL